MLRNASWNTNTIIAQIRDGGFPHLRTLIIDDG